MSSQRNINYPCVGAARLPRSAHICPKLIKPWADKPLMNIFCHYFIYLEGIFYNFFHSHSESYFIMRDVIVPVGGMYGHMSLHLRCAEGVNLTANLFIQF